MAAACAGLWAKRLRPEKLHRMKIGLRLQVSPRNWLAFTQAAEASGWDSVWIPEHLILPVKFGGGPGHEHSEEAPAITADVPLWDPWVQLGYLAGLTSKIRLGTNVYNIGLRHPFITARALTTVELLSNGRVEFGVGVSWLKEEWDLMQQPFAGRGRRADETIAVIKRLFTEEVISHQGEFYQFGEAKFLPKPVQKPWPPFLIGGNSQAAIKRAALIGDGWIPLPETPEALAESLKLLKAMRAEAGRTGPFSITALVGEEQPSLDLLKRYEDIGIDRALIVPWTHVREGVDSIRRYGDEIGSTFT
jgi:probable F420-dependent oxidoreductase